MAYIVHGNVFLSNAQKRPSWENTATCLFLKEGIATFLQRMMDWLDQADMQGKGRKKLLRERFALIVTAGPQTKTDRSRRRQMHAIDLDQELKAQARRNSRKKGGKQ